MFIATGTIKDLMQWFYQDSGEAMCLFVGGSLNDPKILKEILDHRDAFNAISGENVSFFLFWERQEELFYIKRGGYTQVFPGINLGKKFNVYPVERYRIPFERVENEIIRKSQNIAIEICDFFNIRADFLPCMLIIERRMREHYVLQLKGSYSIQDLFNFFKEVRSVADSVADKVAQIRNEIRNIRQDKYQNEEKNRLIKRKENLEQSMLSLGIVEDAPNYKQKCDDLLFFLEKNGANGEELKQKIVSKTHHIDKKIREYIEDNFPNETIRRFQIEVFGNDEYKRLIKDVELAYRRHKKYIDYQSALLKMKKELNDLEYKLENIPDPIPEDVFQLKEQEKQKELEELESKYKQIVDKYASFFLKKNIVGTTLNFIDKYKLSWLFARLFKP